MSHFLAAVFERKGGHTEIAADFPNNAHPRAHWRHRMPNVPSGIPGSNGVAIPMSPKVRRRAMHRSVTRPNLARIDAGGNLVALLGVRQLQEQDSELPACRHDVAQVTWLRRLDRSPAAA